MKEIEIPEGYEARIEGSKVILERKGEEQSMDEKIRQYLLLMADAIRADDFELSGLNKEEVLAYLERQKGVVMHTPRYAPPKQDYSGLTDFERAIHRGFLCAGVENVPVDIIRDTAQDCLAQIKPAEWSEEDDRNINTLIGVIEAHYNEYETVRDDYPINARELGDWLESLRDNYKKCNSHWKPSEEQMAALLNAEGLVRANNYPENAKILASLYTDLKKL